MSNINITKQNISFTIDSLLDIIIHPYNRLDNSLYSFKINERKTFLISLYLYKLIINKEEYLITKYNEYLNKLEIEDTNYNIEELLNIRNKLLNNNYYYDKKDNLIHLEDNTTIDIKWLLPLLIMLLDNTSGNNILKEINICYTISNKDIPKLENLNYLNEYLNEFTYYNIKIQHTDSNKVIKDNNILILKNAAINYLKHFKQYKHELESKDTYKIFYNLLKNECHKQGFILIEEERSLEEIDEKTLNTIKKYIDKQFLTYSINKQTHIIENIVWQSSNDINLLEQINNSIDSCIDLISLLHEEQLRKTYKQLKDYNTIKDIQILEILLVNKFINTYLNPKEELDYSLLDLTRLNPKYMSIICDEEEQELKTRIKQLDKELTQNKKDLEQYKTERSKINKEELKNNYNKELERCVSNINKASINIGTINSKLSTLSKRYEEIKNIQSTKYHNLELYNYNRSIIKHICNSILACSFYLKTNNNSDLLNNIIIFEDYEKTENAFYIEISFNDLLKISKNNIIKGILDQNDLPKLVSD